MSPLSNRDKRDVGGSRRRCRSRAGIEIHGSRSAIFRVLCERLDSEPVALWIWVQPSLRDGVRLYLPDPALKRRAIVGSSLRDLVAFRRVFAARPKSCLSRSWRSPKSSEGWGRGSTCLAKDARHGAHSVRGGESEQQVPRLRKSIRRCGCSFFARNDRISWG